MDMRITPLRMFWSKILPIAYSNYLSETEILNAVVSKLNEMLRLLAEWEGQTTETDEKLQAQIDALKLEVANAIKEIEAIASDVNEKLKEFADMQEDFEDFKSQIEGELADVVSSMRELENSLNARLLSIQHELNLEIEFAKEQAEKNLALAKNQWLLMFNAQWNTLTRWVRKYFNELSSTTIMVISPVSARKMSLQDALEEILGISTTGLTAYQYRMLELTALEYRDLGLSAYEYRMYGISETAVIHPDVHFDLRGNRTHEPMSSVYEVLGYGVHANMDGLNLTAGQYRAISNLYDAEILDRYGALALRGLYDSLDGEHLRLTHDGQVNTGSVKSAIRILEPIQSEDNYDLFGDLGDLPELVTQDALNSITYDTHFYPEYVEEGGVEVPLEYVSGDVGVVETFANHKCFISSVNQNDVDRPAISLGSHNQTFWRRTDSQQTDNRPVMIHIDAYLPLRTLYL